MARWETWMAKAEKFPEFNLLFKLLRLMSLIIKMPDATVLPSNQEMFLLRVTCKIL